MASPRTLRRTSAGGVPYRRRDGELEVALVGLDEPPVWKLPKGHVEPGEDLIEAAAREVREETGLKVVPGEALGSIEYWFYDHEQEARIHKQVHYFLMEALGGELAQRDEEHDRAGWFPAAEAEERLSYQNEREILQVALRRLGGRA